MLKMVFVNLISNAIKFAKDNHQTIIEIGLIDTDSSKITFYIKDNGIGVSDDVLDKIFERFYKEDKARSKSSPGSGLGLYIAQKIILEIFLFQHWL